MSGNKNQELRETLQKVETLKDLLVQFSTGGEADDTLYRDLRRTLLSTPFLRGRLPDFLLSCRNISEYWDFISDEYSSYKERRGFLRDAFNPLLNELEDAAEGNSSLATPESVPPPESQRAKGALRVFVSHAHEDRLQAKILKEVLQEYGMEVFIAHEDITTSKEWEEEILKSLRTTDLFVPILTENFSPSPWTDQETGIAYEKGAEFFPLMVDIVPYGFIGKYQGMRCAGGITVEHVRKLVDELVKSERLRSRVIDSLINALASSSAFAQSNAIVRKLKTVEDQLDTKRVTLICRAWLENNQVREAHTARSFVFELLHQQKEDIDPSILPALEKVVERARVF